MDNKLISAILQDGEAFKKLKTFVGDKPEEIFSDLNVVLWKLAEEYYSTDEYAPCVDQDVLNSMVERKYPRQEETLMMAIDRAVSGELPSTSNVIKEYFEAKKYALGLKLSTALVTGGDTDGLLDEYMRLSGEEALDTDSDVKVYEGPLYSDIADEISKENLIHVYPEELNERIGGGLLRGHHLLVFARPEVGKSLVAMNMARGFVEQGFRVLYVGNEDPAKAMISRFQCSLLGKPRTEIQELTRDAVDDLLTDAGINNFIFTMLDPGTPNEIRGLTDKYKPDVVIVDQLRNLNCKSEGLVHKLETAAKEMRIVAQKCNVLVVSVTQAGDSATDKLVLTMSDVDSSKTGIPAAMDVMVGVGMDQEYQARGKRMFSLCKNKPGNNHDYFSVTVDEATSRIL